MKYFILLTSLIVCMNSHADDKGDQDREKLIVSNPDLRAVLSGECKDADVSKLTSDYIIRGSAVDQDLDKPGSRLWNFANLKNDIAAAITSKIAKPKCLDALATAGVIEQIKYWKVRRAAASCEVKENISTDECKQVEMNLNYASSEAASFGARVDHAIDKVEAIFKKKPTDLEACTASGKCAQHEPNMTALNAVSDQVEAQTCCEVFRKRDGKLTDKECKALRTENKKLPDQDMIECASKVVEGFFKGIIGQVKGLLWDLPISIFNGSFFEGLAVLKHEYEKDKGRALELLVTALSKTLGIDPAYAACLSPGQQLKYRCDVGGNMLSQFAMMAGGWAKVFKVLSAVDKSATAVLLKIPVGKKLADSTKAVGDAVSDSLTAAKNASLELPRIAVANSIDAMRKVAQTLKVRLVDAKKVKIDDPKIEAALADLEKANQSVAEVAAKAKTVTTIQGATEVQAEAAHAQMELDFANQSVHSAIVQESSPVVGRAAAVTAPPSPQLSFLKQKMNDYNDFVNRSAQAKQSIKETNEAIKELKDSAKALDKKVKTAKKEKNIEAEAQAKEDLRLVNSYVKNFETASETLAEDRVTRIKFLKTWINENKRIKSATAIRAAEADLGILEAQKTRDNTTSGKPGASDLPDLNDVAPRATTIPVAKPAAAKAVPQQAPPVTAAPVTDLDSNEEPASPQK